MSRRQNMQSHSDGKEQGGAREQGLEKLHGNASQGSQTPSEQPGSKLHCSDQQ